MQCETATMRAIEKPMEMQDEKEPPAAWCIVATFRPEQATDRKGAPFDSGATVYCFPPNVSGAYETVKVIGADRFGKFASGLVAARDLSDWAARPVHDPAVLPLITPPWDASQVSREVAEGIAAWKAGGPWPTLALRLWNRTHAQRQVGPDSLLGRVRQAIGKALGREKS